jgi:hypothetical protein
MIDDKIITQFIPAQVLEDPKNTHPYARLEDKIKTALRRYISTQSFIEGDIVETTPRLIIVNNYFDPKRMGYDVIARIL